MRPLKREEARLIRVNKVVPRNRPALWVCFAFLFWKVKDMDRIKSMLFTEAADISRINPAGFILMAAALLLSAFSGRLARRLKPDQLEKTKIIIRLISLVLCAGGALLAILG